MKNSFAPDFDFKDGTIPSLSYKIRQADTFPDHILSDKLK